MASFRDQVNANIPRKKSDNEIRNEMILFAQKDASTIAVKVKNRILELAKTHEYIPEEFKYDGFLLSRNYLNRTEHKENSFFGTYTVETITSLNDYAQILSQELKKVLEVDCIITSDWQLVSIFIDDEFIYSLGIDTHYNGKVYLIDEELNDLKHLCFKIINGPYPFDSAVRTVGKYDKLSHGKSGVTYYKDKVINGIISPWACIIITYKNN